MNPDLDALFHGLRRWPDLETPELQAWDAADRLLLDEASDLLRGADVAIIGDNYGALTLGALELGAASVRVHQDSLIAERALEANGGGAARSLPLGAELVARASVVLVRLPRSLDALDEIAAVIAASAGPDVTVLAGGRLKHMTTAMNEVLSRHFGEVTASLARQKSRLLVARRPIGGSLPEPGRQFHADWGMWVVAHGGVFAGTSIDIGTRAMLSVLDQAPDAGRILDFGCGSGVLAVAMARSRPGATIVASDVSSAAVASAAMTAAANGVAIEARRDDALSLEADASANLVLLNPPFHSGAAVHSGIASPLFEAAARVLRPGGELWTVWNTHLGYRQRLESIVGPTRQLARTPKFTVTASRRD